MPKTEFSKNLDALQREVRPFLKSQGFKVKGRSFNRETSEGLTQVIQFYLDSDSYAFGVIHESTESPPGRFWVELGICIPEALEMRGDTPPAWKKSYDCSIRRRMVGPDGRRDETFWNCLPVDVIGRAAVQRIETDVFPLFDRFATRSEIVAEFDALEQRQDYNSYPPGVVSAAILARMGDPEGATLRLQREYERSVAEGRGAYGDVIERFAKNLGLEDFTLPNL